MRTASTRLRTETAEAFDRVCYAHGLSRYEALRRFCLTVVHDDTLLERLTVVHIDPLDRGVDVSDKRDT